MLIPVASMYIFVIMIRQVSEILEGPHWKRVLSFHWIIGKYRDRYPLLGIEFYRGVCGISHADAGRADDGDEDARWMEVWRCDVKNVEVGRCGWLAGSSGGTGSDRRRTPGDRRIRSEWLAPLTSVALTG